MCSNYIPTPMAKLADCFGMVPTWADMKLATHTYNARSETVGGKLSFRHAWRKQQLAVITGLSITT